MSRRFWWGGSIALGLAGVAAVGFVPWRVTGWVQGLLNGLPQQSGWLFSVGEARWIPWRGLELDHLQVRTPAGGKIHLVRAEVFLKVGSLMRGKVSTQWHLGEIRVDPGSWRIRQALAREILSAMPVTTRGSALLHVLPQEIQFERFSLAGPILRVSGQASFRNPEEMHLRLSGDLSHAILQALHLLSPRESSLVWQPFHLRLDGRARSPRIEFDSSFRSFTLDRPVEGKP